MWSTLIRQLSTIRVHKHGIHQANDETTLRLGPRRRKTNIYFMCGLRCHLNSPRFRRGVARSRPTCAVSPVELRSAACRSDHQSTLRLSSSRKVSPVRRPTHDPSPPVRFAKSEHHEQFPDSNSWFALCYCSAIFVKRLGLRLRLGVRVVWKTFTLCVYIYIYIYICVHRVLELSKHK